VSPPEGYHVRAMVDITSATCVRYHSYQFDDQLRRLVNNGSLQSRLFRLYLQAKTSHCLVDQLTGRIGTKEALEGFAGGQHSVFRTNVIWFIFM
jgi:hypothetical protein